MKTFAFVAVIGQLVLSLAGSVLACGGHPGYCHTPAPRALVKQQFAPISLLAVRRPPAFAPQGIANQGIIGQTPLAPVANGNNTPAPFVAPPSGGRPGLPVGGQPGLPIGGQPGVAGGNNTATPFVAGNNTPSPLLVGNNGQRPGGVPGGNSTATPFIANPAGGPQQGGPVAGGNQTRIPFVAPQQRGR